MKFSIGEFNIILKNCHNTKDLIKVEELVDNYVTDYTEFEKRVIYHNIRVRKLQIT